METCLAGADQWRGGSGPLVLERGPATNPLFGAFFEAAQQAGYPLTDDVNGYRQEGFAPSTATCTAAAGCSAARAYLHPVMRRPNLRVETLAMVTGLRLRRQAGHRRRLPPRRPGGPPRRRRRGHPLRRRDQLAAAAAARPASVPKADLEALGDRRRRRPAGRRRATCRTTSRSTSSTPASSRSRSVPGSSTGTSHASARSGCSCAAGVGATNHFEGGGFIRSNDVVDYPNLMFHFLPIAIRYDGSRPAAEHGYQVHIGPMYSDVRGNRAPLKSRDPHEHPALRFNYLSTENDRREWIEMVRAARDILNQPAFAAFNAGELSPGPVGRHRPGDPRLGREDAETALHPSCTARMGVDDDVGARP